MTYFKKEFGKNLRLIRKIKGLTQEKLAEMINLNQRQLTRIENGISFVSSDVIEKLIFALNIEPKDLFDFKIKDDTLEKIENEQEIIQNKTIDNIFNKIKKLANNEKQLKYIELAIDSLSNKKTRKELKTLIDGMELIG